MLTDSGYKLLFSHPRLMRDLLMQFVQVIRPETLDFESLSRVNGSFVTDMGQRHCDMIWKIRFAEDEWVYIYLLLEFQSGIEPWMVLRMQGYILGLFQGLIKHKELSDGKLPPVLPLVLYNGSARWSAATELAALQAPVPANLQPFQPSLKYLLIDEGAQNVAALDRSNLVTLLFSLEHSGPDELSQVISELSVHLTDSADTTLRRDFTRFVIWLLRRKVRKTSIPDVGDLCEVQTMLMERRLDWWEQWMNEGHSKGLAEGRAAGRAEGVVLGESAILRRQLARRFGNLPPWAESKLTSGTADELMRWGERLLEAKALEDVFSG